MQKDPDERSDYNDLLCDHFLQLPRDEEEILNHYRKVVPIKSWHQQ